MANVAGILALGGTCLDRTDLTALAMESPDALNLAAASDASAGPPAGDALISATAPSVLGGVGAALFGSELWEKIIVTPSVVAIGYILGTVQLAVDVWCTRQRAAAAMSDLEVSGSGLSAANPYGLPLTYWPMQARDFEVLIPEEGDAQLDGAVIFLFDGVAAADTTCAGDGHARGGVSLRTGLE